MALVYAAVARKARSQGTALAPTAAFVAGYVLVWTLFSAAATLAQWWLERAALLFGSGALANMGVIAALARRGEIVLHDELSHSSILDGCRLSGAEVMPYLRGMMHDFIEAGAKKD